MTPSPTTPSSHPLSSPTTPRPPPPVLALRPGSSQDPPIDPIPESSSHVKHPSSADSGQDTEAYPKGKKKRTRTLTTPHQSAVLHALLAQVCSPLAVLTSPILPV